MRPLFKNAILMFLPLIALFVIYVLYLFNGGKVGREEIKRTLQEMRIMRQEIRTTRTSTYTLTAGPKGGDCQQLGHWDDRSLACTLSTSLGDDETIHINADGLSLDGNNQSMNGNGKGVAIQVISKRMVSISNLKINGYDMGVLLQNTTASRISNLDIGNSTSHGMSITGGSNYNIIEDNRIGLSEIHGINVNSSHGIQFIGNYIFSTKDGIRTQNSYGNIFTGNIFANNRVEGLDFHSSEKNLVFFNTFLTNEEISIISDLNANTNYYNIDSGGNYYSSYDEPSEGCHDIDNNGFCDDPYIVDGVRDNLPFSRKDGWKR